MSTVHFDRHGDLGICVQDSRCSSSGAAGLSPHRGPSAVFLGESLLNSHSVSLHPDRFQWPLQNFIPKGGLLALSAFLPSAIFFSFVFLSKMRGKGAAPWPLH